jgi:hypothetical protein
MRQNCKENVSRGREETTWNTFVLFRREDNINNCVCVDWIHKAQDTEKWRALLNVVMNCPFAQKAGNLSPAEQLLSSQEGLCFIALDTVR